MAKPANIDDKTFNDQISTSSAPSLVDFWAPWCGPCQMVAPVVEDLAQEYDGRVNFLKLNTDENPLTPAKYGIRGIPTLIVFKDGNEVGRIVGFRPKEDIKKILENALLSQ